MPGKTRKAATAFRLEGESRSPAKTMGPRAQRTTELIRQTARQVFLAKGYFGTRIDDIAEAAGVSRASFYTYFPTKRDLLLALGAETHREFDRTLAEIEGLESSWGPESMTEVVRIYLKFLDQHGAFVLVWNQATYGDDELAEAGLRSRLLMGRRMGEFLARRSGSPSKADQDPARVGIAMLVMIDRYWSYWRVNGFPFAEDEIIETLTQILTAVSSVR